MYNLEQKQRDLEKGKEIFMKKKLVSSAILAAALAVTSVVPAFAEGDTSEVYWYSNFWTSTAPGYRSDRRR